MRPGENGGVLIDLPKDKELWRALKAVKEGQLPDIPNEPGEHAINGASEIAVIDGLTQVVQLGVNSQHPGLRSPAALAIEAFDNLGYDVDTSSGFFDGVTKRN